jgi:ABC-type multidrug transport system fused ATPase/permease subunit
MSQDFRLISKTGRSWWLKLWSGSYEESDANLMSSYAYSFQHLMTGPSTAQSGQDTLLYYLGVYCGISLFSSLIGTFMFFYIFVGSMRASKRLFDKLSWTILRTPLRWIDTVPLGRILNRFTADFTVVDSRLAMDVSYFSSNFLQLIGVIIAR